MNRLAALALLVLLPRQDLQEREAVQKVFASVRSSFVPIEIQLKKKSRLEKAELEQENVDAELQAIYQLAENRQPFDTWAVALDKEGTLIMADRGLKAEDIEKIVVADSQGKKGEASIASIGRNFDAIFLKASGTFIPADFSAFEKFKIGDYFYCTTMEKVDQQRHLNVSPYIVTSAPVNESKDWFLIDPMRRGATISDRSGNLVGIALDQYLWVKADGRNSFLGKSLVADERIALATLAEKTAAFKKTLDARLCRVEVLFRQEKQAEAYPLEDTGSAKAVLFGLPIDDRGLLFVPQELTREQVRRIEDLKVVQDSASYPCTFVGSFKEFGGLLLRAEGLATQPAIAADGSAPPSGALFFTAVPEDRFGRTRIQINPNRIFRTERGLMGMARFQLRTPTAAGAFLLDFDGRVIGCTTTDRKEEDVDEAALDSVRERYSYDRRGYKPEYLKHLLFFGELKPLLSEPSAHFDPKSVPMTKKEEKRMVWLGVEYQELTEPLAEVLGVQDRELTDEGKRGLLLTDIYPASPAEKLRLQTNDILLSVKVEGAPKATDLVPDQDRFGMYRGGFSRFGGPPPWKPSRNFLTSLLTEIGAGKKVSLEYLRDHEKKNLELTLEYAPVDFETAEKYKDDDLGLTVKDLTYEVRHFQKVDPGATGVVAVKIESGRKAEIAKLQLYSIITRVNKVPVKDVAHFKQLMGDFKSSHARSATLTTLSYGQTKLVEIAGE